MDDIKLISLPPSLVCQSVHVMGETDAPATGRIHDDVLAAEVPVALVFNGISHAVMMATPLNLDVFGLGFALSEGIIDTLQDVRDIDILVANPTSTSLPAGITALEVHLTISPRCFERLKHKRRSMAGRTGCGICGVESLAALDFQCPPMQARPWVKQINLPTVLRAFAQLPTKQLLNAQSGALHAAGWATVAGDLIEVFEDVGRHNALDKLLGTLARAKLLNESGFVVMSSRASHELVRKCTRLNIAALATISAATSMGVRMAELSGLRLWGLCRAPRGVLYAAGPSPSLNNDLL